MATLLHGPAGEQPTVKTISVTLKPGDVEKIVPWQVQEEVSNFVVVGCFAIPLFQKR